MTIKETLEQREREYLCDMATFSYKSRGRSTDTISDDLRTEFQRDRDRILHSKAFRRLMHKTQVFLCPDDEYYRTRLTHTLEVSQIARTIARSLRLNEDLTEAIALGHDLGHAPFGHAGERVLAKVFSPDFTHYKQSLRVVEVLEPLNLTYEVKDGIINHAGDNMASTPEGVIVKYADRIAYINHDIDDALRAKILCTEDIPLHLRNTLGHSHSARISTMVHSVVNCGIKNGINMQSDVKEATDKLRQFLFEKVYTNPSAKGEEAKAALMLEQLYNYFKDNGEKIPEQYKNCDPTANTRRQSADFICDMTDKYAIAIYEKLYVPELWRGYGGIL